MNFPFLRGAVTNVLKCLRRKIIWSRNFVMKTKFGEPFKIYKFDIHKNSLLLTNPCCRDDEAADPDTSFLTGADSSDFIDLTAKF